MGKLHSPIGILSRNRSLCCAGRWLFWMRT